MPIYESPDKGETVYVRAEGSAERVLHAESELKQTLHEQIKEDQLWGESRRAARKNEALQSVLNRAIIVYHLSKDNGKK